MIVDYAIYESGQRRSGEIPLDHLYEQCRERQVFAWLGMAEPTEHEFESVRREFELHELAVEDAIHAHQLPKLERYGNSLFLVLKSARWVAATEEIEFGEILLFVGEDFIVSVRHGEAPLHDVRLSLEARPELLRHGPSAALHGIIDRIVDHYDPVLDALEAAVGEVERQVFSPSGENPAARIYHLKREVLELHRAIHPLREPVDALARGVSPLIHGKMRPYFRDVHDHLTRAAARVQDNREALTSVLTANLTQVSVRQNEDVRKISAWAAIVAVPTAIAGIYGMNFEHMPELAWTLGYPVVIVAIAIACAALYRRFRRAGWL